MIKQSYYIITNSSLVHHRANKEINYDFKDILYIDEVYTKKHHTLLFYTNSGKDRFLILDKDELIYKILKEKCHNLLLKSEFQAKFPKIKL